MTRRFLGRAAVVGLGVVAAIALRRDLHGQAQNPPTIDAAVVGRVIDQLTGAPVPLVQVCADPPCGFGEGVMTDAEGRFVLRDLPATAFAIGASALRPIGHAPGMGQYGQKNWTDAPVRISTRQREILRDVMVPFWPYGAVSGRVIDEGGTPIAGAEVKLVRETNHGGSQQIEEDTMFDWQQKGDGFIVEGAVTNARGKYRLAHGPGAFFIHASTQQMRARAFDTGSTNNRP
jgi:hypothetical protein